jgi:hypothetical protein
MDGVTTTTETLELDLETRTLAVAVLARYHKMIEADASSRQNNRDKPIEIIATARKICFVLARAQAAEAQIVLSSNESA